MDSTTCIKFIWVIRWSVELLCDGGDKSIKNLLYLFIWDFIHREGLGLNLLKDNEIFIPQSNRLRLFLFNLFWLIVIFCIRLMFTNNFYVSPLSSWFLFWLPSWLNVNSKGTLINYILFLILNRSSLSYFWTSHYVCELFSFILSKWIMSL